ncbi:MAG: cytochrome c3 family protein [Oxalobacteraceae bacterium]|nr:cytochrome c3 family protein [Oxalobacteraceae bacterium]
MKKSGFSLFVVVALFAMLAGGSRLYAMLVADSSQHLAKSDCAGCHMAGKNVSPQQAGLLIASQEALCGKCHPTALKISHPSGFTPQTKPPETYPLDWKGDLTCSTCHDIHGNSPGLMRGTSQGKDLCLTCHDPKFFQKMRDGGSSMMVGHLGSGSDVNTPTLDAYSRQCLECHGRNGDPKLSTNIDRNGVLRHASSSINHPIGVNYQQAAAFGGYRARAIVERKIVLPNGQVGCVSCHLGYSKEHGKLVSGTARSTLCFECHDL